MLQKSLFVQISTSKNTIFPPEGRDRCWIIAHLREAESPRPVVLQREETDVTTKRETLPQKEKRRHKRRNAQESLRVFPIPPLYHTLYRSVSGGK